MWAFNKKRPGDSAESNGEPGNAEIVLYSNAIKEMYKELLGYGYRYTELYEMDMNELMESLWAQRESKATEMYNQAVLISWAMGGKHFPKSPRDAMPGMFRPRKTYAMPEALRKKIQNGGKSNGQ